MFSLYSTTKKRFWLTMHKIAWEVVMSGEEVKLTICLL